MADQSERDESHPLRRVTLRNFESAVDQQIREAEASGAFQNLPGAGRPQDLRADDQVPDELRAGFRMLKNANVAPPWIELQKSIRADQAQLAAWLGRANRRWPQLGPGQRQQLRDEYRERLRDLNKQISTYNLTAPPAVGQIPLLIIAAELAKLGGDAA